MAGRKYEQDRSKVHKQSINFAVSQKEKDRIIQEAEAMGMSMSGYIRYRLFIKEAKLMNIKKFVKERNEAIFSLEKEKIVAYCKKYDVPIPENEQVFWAGVYKSILAIENSPEHLRQKAIEWLDEHGFKRTTC